MSDISQDIKWNLNVPMSGNAAWLHELLLVSNRTLLWQTSHE